MLLQAGPKSAETHLHCSMEGYGNAGKDLVHFWGSCSFLLKQFSITERGSGGVTLSALSELAGLNLSQVCLMMFNCFSGYSTDESQRKCKDCKMDKFWQKTSLSTIPLNLPSQTFLVCWSVRNTSFQGHTQSFSAGVHASTSVQSQGTFLG